MKAMLNKLKRLRRKAVTRKRLLALTDTELRDIGITRCEAEREGKRFFWR